MLGSADPISLNSTARLSWMKLREQATVAGPLPETARGQTRRASVLAQDASAPPRLPTPLAQKNQKRCPNHRDTTQTETSGQSRSFTELDLPTKLELSRGPTCESLWLKPVQIAFSRHLFWDVCSLVATADLRLEQQTARLGEKRDHRNSCSTKRRVWI